MGERYQHIVQELYEKRFINQHTAINSYDRVRLLQKKMNEPISKKPSKINFHFNINDSTTLLEDADSEAPKRIIRQQFDAGKLMQRGRRFSLPTQRKSYEEFNEVETPNSMTSILKKNQSLTQRMKAPGIPTSLYHSRKFQIIKRKTPLATDEQSTQRQQFAKRATTPSKNVSIGGCNLEEEAQAYRKQFLEMEIEIQKYNKELMLKEGQRSITSRVNSNKHKHATINFRKENWMQKPVKHHTKKLSSRGKEKQENVELMPWAVLVPEFEYY